MRSLWSFSKYIIARNLWKSVVVPGVTYGNAIVVRDGLTQKKMERIQREVTRYSLGCRFTCSREFLEGEGAMSTFRERETRSKLLYSLRLKKLDCEAWPSKLQKIKVLLKLKTKWDRRVEFHARLLGFNKKDWENSTLAGGEIRKLVKQKFEDLWRRSLEKRTSLQVYREHKLLRGYVDRLYDNSRGSGLLANARAGMLNTQVLRSHYTNVDKQCRLCKKEIETIDHVVLRCEKLGVRTVPLDVALGLGLRRNFREINTTKSRLSEWEACISATNV